MTPDRIQSAIDLAIGMLAGIYLAHTSPSLSLTRKVVLGLAAILAFAVLP